MRTTYIRCRNECKIVELNTPCKECGEIAERNIAGRGSNQVQVLGYFDEHLDAYISGPQQKKRVMRAKGVEEIGNG